jgi:23S rRNA (pseudouridine1915-N3)-methyltransferase
LKIKVISIGKTKEDWVIAGVDEYLRRLKRYAALDYMEIPAVKFPDQAKEGVLLEEAKRFEAHLKPGNQVILLDDKGLQLDSVEFSAWMNKRFTNGGGDLVFLIGGPFGFHESIRKRALDYIALSRMTFTHQMVRVIFLEQMYRAMTILKNEPYHHS